uniref:Deoxynivalenol-UDP-glucosyltransferase n=2 Tax=Leersia perrieri TaxID=77586 RepID=A0A0D9W2M5_9ORYZ
MVKGAGRRRRHGYWRRRRQVSAGRLALPVTAEDARGLYERGVLGVELGNDDVPPFAARPEWQPTFIDTLVRQFDGLEDADDVLVNSSSDLEPKEAAYMEETWHAKMIGPLLPSFYLDDVRLPSNKDYGFNLFRSTVSCMEWLDKQPSRSVVLVSYGTVSDFDAARLEELGHGLCNSGKPFLWVVRSNEEHKLSHELRRQCEAKGLIVPFCPQLEVLAHKATGCFLTHCGWNSTLEAIVNGIPLVAMPHWADQPTIAKYTESVWEMGICVRRGKNGALKREEVERCIKEVMDGERKDDYRQNAMRLMNKAKEAMQDGGRSDKNIVEFATKRSRFLCCFLSHCGWNSTLEAIVNGVPLVAIPHWADQPTTSKYMESLWGMGVRVRHDKGGGLQREEVERCIREVMEGDKKEDYKKNAVSSSTPAPASTATCTILDDDCSGGQVLLLPFPAAQGHTNPLLQFGRRLAYHGLRPTLVTTRHVLATTPPPGEPFRVAAISDGFDDAGGMAACPDFAEYVRSLEQHGSRTLAELLASTEPAVRVLVYDPHLAWARRVARDAGVPAAAFLSQPCAVDIIYGEVFAGRLALPVTAADARGLYERGVLGVELGHDDVPPFAARPEWHSTFIDKSVRQFDGLEDADDVLVNSSSDLEPKEAAYMEETWHAKMIGPLLPSFYLDDVRLPSNKDYGFNLFRSTVSCMEWLDKQPSRSVVLVSYGTVSDFDAAKLEELGHGLCNSGKPFLWVVRSNEEHKLSHELRRQYEAKGLIVPFCPQLEVLAHKATGCFLTHCGWNSTLEAIVNGIPLVAMPHWADQPTIAKYMESVWEMGVRVQRGKNGALRREEVERCIKEVMDGERKDDYRQNAMRLMSKAKEAMQDGGRSDKNIVEFAVNSKYHIDPSIFFQIGLCFIESHDLVRQHLF